MKKCGGGGEQPANVFVKKTSSISQIYLFFIILFTILFSRSLSMSNENEANRKSIQFGSPKRSEKLHANFLARTRSAASLFVSTERCNGSVYSYAIKLKVFLSSHPDSLLIVSCT